jgi:hypothetical protein
MKAILFAMISTALLILLALPGTVAAQGTDPGSVVTAFDAALNAGDVEAR